MSDVFISYARSTAVQASAAAAALRAAGYSVWLDEDLPAHRPYAREIEAQLTAAKAALVIWSAEAVESEWVLSEANRAREERKLVQVNVDSARLPMPFDQIQCADLSGWTRDGAHSGWRKALASIAALAGQAETPASTLAAGPEASPTAAAVLAVLAFDNLSGDADMTYFSDGVSEEIRETLARGADLRVIGRASSFHFRGHQKAAANIASQLGATHVLDGSVRRSGQRVRISADLVSCADATTLWSERFDRELTDVFALQDEIAAAVAGSLKVVLARTPGGAPADSGAYELYLKALELVGGYFNDHAAMDAAVGLLERATNLDPKFARAWSTLATTLADRFQMHGTTERYQATRAQVINAAETALTLDSRSGAAYAALAGLEPAGAWARTATLVEKAVSLSPNDPSVLWPAFSFYGRVGRHGEAFDLAKQAFDLDPMSINAANIYATALAVTGRYLESRELSDRFIALWPDITALLSSAIAFAENAADWDRVEALVKLAGERGQYKGSLADQARFARNRRTKNPAYAAGFLQHARGELERTGNLSGILVVNLCQIGLADEAFHMLEQASFDYVTDAARPWPGAGSDCSVLSLSMSADLIRDPRFLRYCAKLGLCDYWVQTDLWPDCADEVPYDFRAEARRLAAA